MHEDFENRWRGIKIIIGVTSDPPRVEYLNPCVLNDREERVAFNILKKWVKENAERFEDESTDTSKTS